MEDHFIDGSVLHIFVDSSKYSYHVSVDITYGDSCMNIMLDEFLEGKGSASVNDDLTQLRIAPNSAFLPNLAKINLGVSIPYFTLTPVTANTATVNVDFKGGGLRQVITTTYTGGNIALNISKDPWGPCNILLKIVTGQSSNRRITS